MESPIPPCALDAKIPTDNARILIEKAKQQANNVPVKEIFDLDNNEIDGDNLSPYIKDDATISSASSFKV